MFLGTKSRFTKVCDQQKKSQLASSYIAQCGFPRARRKRCGSTFAGTVGHCIITPRPVVYGMHGILTLNNQFTLFRTMRCTIELLNWFEALRPWLFFLLVCIAGGAQRQNQNSPKMLFHGFDLLVQELEGLIMHIYCILNILCTLPWNLFSPFKHSSVCEFTSL